MPELSESRFQKLEDKVSKIYDQLREVNRNTQTLNDSFVHFNKEFEAFRVRLEDTVKEMKDVRKEVGRLEAENRILKKEMSELRGSMEDAFHASKEKDLNIVGIPPSSNEDLKKTFGDICGKLAIKFHPKDLVDIRRIPVKNGNLSLVSVSCVNKDFRDKLLERGKKSKLLASDIGFGSSKNSIFFSMNPCLLILALSLLWLRSLGLKKIINFYGLKMVVFFFEKRKRSRRF